MKKILFIISIFLIFISFSGCNGCSQSEDTSYLDVSDYSLYEDDQENSSINNDNSIKISYTEMSDNTITIPVKINGMGLNMIFDTGASSTCITLAEAEYLYSKGNLSGDDILDYQPYQTADGNISVGLLINLREVIIGDKLLFRDVEAVVVENQQAPLLLGQSVMKHFGKISVDRENEVVEFFLSK